jgi:hypothetical protein
MNLDKRLFYTQMKGSKSARFIPTGAPALTAWINTDFKKTTKVSKGTKVI